LKVKHQLQSGLNLSDKEVAFLSHSPGTSSLLAAAERIGFPCRTTSTPPIGRGGGFPPKPSKKSLPGTPTQTPFSSQKATSSAPTYPGTSNLSTTQEGTTPTAGNALGSSPAEDMAPDDEMDLGSRHENTQSGDSGGSQNRWNHSHSQASTGDVKTTFFVHRAPLTFGLCPSPNVHVPALLREWLQASFQHILDFSLLPYDDEKGQQVSATAQAPNDDLAFYKNYYHNHTVLVHGNLTGMVQFRCSMPWAKLKNMRGSYFQWTQKQSASQPDYV